MIDKSSRNHVVGLHTFEMAKPSFMFLVRGKQIVIHLDSGEIDIPEDVAPNEAAKAFWDAVRQMAGNT